MWKLDNANKLTDQANVWKSNGTWKMEPVDGSPSNVYPSNIRAFPKFVDKTVRVTSVVSWRELN